MAIKLIALDIDSTLVPYSGIVSPANLSAIRDAQEAGVYVTTASGRGYRGSRPVFEQIHVAGPVICFGGALTMDTRTDTALNIHAMSPETVLLALETAHRLGVHIHIYLGDAVVTESETAFYLRYTAHQGLTRRYDPEIRQKRWENVPKLLAYAEENEDETRAAFSEALNGVALVSKSERGFIEINAPEANKGYALRDLAASMGILREEVAALGDSYLDIPMLEWAGDGVCMENGLDPVKRIADRIVPSCADDGVAYYIRNFVL